MASGAGADAMPDRGDCRIDVYLTGVSAAEIDELSEEIADLLARHGLAAAGEESEIRSLIGIKAVPFPDFGDEEAAAGIVDEYGEWLIPSAEDVEED